MLRRFFCGGLLILLLAVLISGCVCESNPCPCQDENEDITQYYYWNDDAIQPTDTEPGWTASATCIYCHRVLVPPVRIPSLHEQDCEAAGSHISPVVDHAISPTCLHAGLTEGSHCAHCLVVIRKQEPVPATGHAWDIPQYTWSSDYSQATAKRICLNDLAHTEEETVNTSSVITPATYEAPGRIVYTAIFSGPAFAAQTAEVILPQLESPPVPSPEPVETPDPATSAPGATDPATPDPAIPPGPYRDPNGTGNYNINSDGTATFTGPSGSGNTVIVPDSIDVNGRKIPVTAVGDKAFYKNQKLKTVTIGKKVKSIGKNAFAGCTKLKTVKGGKGIVTLKDSAFSGCKVLKTFPVPGHLETIGQDAFRGCGKMAEFTLGAAVKSIGENAFNGCTGLRTIIVKTVKLTTKNVKEGAFRGINKKAIIRCPKKKKDKYRTLFLSRGAPDTCKFK